MLPYNNPAQPATATEAAAIIAVAREAEKNKTPLVTTLANDLQIIISPSGSITSLERFADHPRRKRAVVTLYEIASFIAYVNRHKIAGHTHLFGAANEAGGSFTAIIDYHGDESDPDSPAQWGEHRVVGELVTTPEWKRWIANNGKILSQEAFAEYIEDNLLDIKTPDAADILEIAQGLQGRKTVTFKSGKNLRDGSIKFEYSEDVLVNGSASRRDDSFKVPEKFVLSIVPFIGGNGVEIEARLRFRIGDGGKLSFAYILNRPFKVVEAAFEAARGDIEREIAQPVMLGSASLTAPAS